MSAGQKAHAGPAEAWPSRLSKSHTATLIPLHPGATIPRALDVLPPPLHQPVWCTTIIPHNLRQSRVLTRPSGHQSTSHRISHTQERESKRTAAQRQGAQVLQLQLAERESERQRQEEALLQVLAQLQGLELGG